MVLCDSNVWLALALSNHVHHKAASAWLETVEEPAGLERQWKKLAVRNTASPKLWMDAYLAAFAIAGRYSMVTTDSAFRQFRELDLLVLG